MISEFWLVGNFPMDIQLPMFIIANEGGRAYTKRLIQHDITMLWPNFTFSMVKEQNNVIVLCKLLIFQPDTALNLYFLWKFEIGLAK